MDDCNSFLSTVILEAEQHFDVCLTSESVFEQIFSKLKLEMKNVVFCFAAEKANEKLALFQLNEYILGYTVCIFSFLNERETFALRSVCKHMKRISEAVLQRRKQLTITRKMNTIHLEAMATIYSNISHLTLRNIWVSFEALASICRTKFPNLKSIRIEKCDTGNIEAIAESFAEVDMLAIVDCGGSHKHNDLTALLQRLPCLQHIKLNNVYVSPDICCCIASQLKSMEFVCDESFTFSELDVSIFVNATNLECLSLRFNHWLSRVDIVVFASIMLYLQNLKILKIHYQKSLHGLEHFALFNLQELYLRVWAIEDTYLLPEKVDSVKTVTLDVANIDDINLSTFLSNFPCIENLTISLSRNEFFRLTILFIETLRSFVSLKSLTILDTRCKRNKYFTLNNGNRNALIEIVQSLEFVSNITFKLKESKRWNVRDNLPKDNEFEDNWNGEPVFHCESIASDDCDDNDVSSYKSFCENLINEIELIAVQRPKQYFSLAFCRQFRLDQTLPMNLRVIN